LEGLGTKTPSFQGKNAKLRDKEQLPGNLRVGGPSSRKEEKRFEIKKKEISENTAGKEGGLRGSGREKDWVGKKTERGTRSRETETTGGGDLPKPGQIRMKKVLGEKLGGRKGERDAAIPGENPIRGGTAKGK